jgi:hypothetical protein
MIKPWNPHKKFRNSNYNEQNIEGWKLKKINLKKVTRVNLYQ